MKLISARLILSSTVYTVSAIAIFLMVENDIPDRYTLLPILPIAYMVFYSVFLARPLLKYSTPFLITYFVVSFIRYTVLPCCIVYSQFFGGMGSYLPIFQSYETGFELMVYELIVAGIAIHFIAPLKLGEHPITVIKPPLRSKTGLFYVGTIMAGVCLFGAVPDVREQLNFISIGGEFSSIEDAAFIRQLIYIVISAKLFIFFIMMSYLQYLYERSGKAIYEWLAYIVCFLNIAFFIGANRGRVLCDAIATMVLLIHLFPKHRIRHIVVSWIGAFGLIASISAYRIVDRIYGSYDSFSSDFGLEWVVVAMQAYFSGPHNMALAVDTSIRFGDSITIINVVYDLLRPCYGIGFLLKDVDIPLVSRLFNAVVFDSDVSSQIIPLVGQGYLYFGFLFAPVFDVMLIYLAFCTEKIAYASKKLEIRYLMMYSAVRLGMMMGLNATILINDLSMYLVLNLMLIWLNYKIVISKSSFPITHSIGLEK